MFPPSINKIRFRLLYYAQTVRGPTAKPYYERVKLAGRASLLENPIKFENKTTALKPNYEAIGNYVREP